MAPVELDVTQPESPLQRMPAVCKGRTPTPSGLGPRSEMARRRAPASLPLLDDDTASPGSRRFESRRSRQSANTIHRQALNLAPGRDQPLNQGPTLSLMVEALFFSMTVSVSKLKLPR